MTGKQTHLIQIQSKPLSGPLSGAAYSPAAIGYLFGLFVIQHTPVNLLLLTGIYGTWTVVYHFGKRRVQLDWRCALFCLACASLFIPTPSTDVYWLPILPTTTACLLLTTRPRLPGLLAAILLWLSTGLALGLISQHWDIGGQAILLISFSSTCACTATISELVRTQAQLQAYSAEVEDLSIIRERNRIAREIHDTLGHSLTLLTVQLETALQHEVRGDLRLHEELLEARQVAKDCLRDVRYSVTALRPEEATLDALKMQLQRLATEFATTSQETSITLDLEEATHPLHPDQCMALYRCTQEALTNIRKHAHATKVLLRLSTSDEPTNQVELTVLDNGQGSTLAPSQSPPGFGLLGMRERVTLLHGTLRAGPEARQGWRVEVLLPLAQRKHGEQNSRILPAPVEKI